MLVNLLKPGERFSVDGSVPSRSARPSISATVRPTPPGLYDSFLPAPTPEQDPELATALREPVTVIGSVLAEMGIDATTIIPLIRALRASVHGFVDLELRGDFGLPDDIDDSFTTTINLVIETIAGHSTRDSLT